MADPIKIFIGSAASGEDAESLAVLCWSVKKHASRPFEIVLMQQSHDPSSFWHGWNTETWATPFSAFRAGIPAFCGYEGRAIYVDSDIFFQADPAELFDQEFQPGKVLRAKGGGSWRMCVSLWDCAAAKQWLPPIETLKADRKALANVTAILRANDLIQAFDGEWNCLDGKGYDDINDPRIKAVHYTDMGTQPHLRHALPRLKAAGVKHWFDGEVRPHPRPDLVAKFDRLLVEAEEHGWTVDSFVPDEPFGPYRKASLVNYRGAPK